MRKTTQIKRNSFPKKLFISAVVLMLSLVGIQSASPAAPTYSVTYFGNTNTGGTVPIDGTAYANNATVTVLGNTGSLVRTGYTFSGWNTLANGTGTSHAPGSTFQMSPPGASLYAQWTLTPVSHTVTFDSNGGAGTMAPQVASTSTALTLNSFTRTGYSFTGWNEVANGSGTAHADGATYSFAADITLYAQWAPVNHTVTFDSNGLSLIHI